MASHPTPLNWFSILALGVIWGGTFAIMAIALEGFGPVTVATARTTLGAVSLLLLVAIMRRAWPVLDARMIKYLILIGVLTTTLPFSLLSWGLQYVPSAFAGLSMAALPLFVLPLAHVFTDERLSLRALFGVIVGFIGAAILIGPGALRLGQGPEAAAQLACVAAAICYALASILTRRCPPVDPIVLATAGLIVGALTMLPLMLLTEGPPVAAGARPTVALIALGLLPTALAALLRTHTIRTAGSVFMTLVNYQVPVWAMVFGAWLLSEALPWRFFLALGLILTGLAISQWSGLRRIFRRAGPSS